jgi:nucleotide-binding universal stress UspA family protein
MGRVSSEIVCAVLRPGEERAVRLAAQLGRRLGEPVVLVDLRTPLPPPGVMPVEGVVPTTPPPPLAAGDEGVEPRADLAALAERAGATGARHEILVGAPGDALRQLTERPAIDLLVVTDSGGGPVAAKLGGNAGRDVLRDARCPVVLVPAASTGALPDPLAIVCGAGDDPAGEEVTGFAEALARRLDASLEIVRVGDDAATAIRDAARAAGAGLVVVGPPARGALGAALRGSVAHDVLQDSDVPVVVASR